MKLETYLKMVFCVVTVQVAGLLSLRIEHALYLTGVISACCSIISAFSILSTVPTVIQRQSSASIPTPLVVTSFISNCLWITCGLLLNDPAITVPSFVGTCTCMTCFLLKGLYPEEPGSEALLVSCVPKKSTSSSMGCCVKRDGPMLSSSSSAMDVENQQ